MVVHTTQEGVFHDGKDQEEADQEEVVCVRGSGVK